LVSLSELFQADESLEISREATPDSDSGYVVSTVTTTTRINPSLNEKPFSQPEV